MSTSPAFDPNAPADERTQALGELQKAYAPTSESGLILPVRQMAELAADIRAEVESEMMAKAVVVPFPSQNAQHDRRGMQSVDWDPLQANRDGEYWERPSLLGFEQMRQMVDQTPVLSAAIMTRVRQATRFCRPQESAHGPGFEIRHVDATHELQKDEAESIDLLQRFIMNCGWEFNPRKRRALERDTFSKFIAKSVRDSLVLDAAPIETELKQDRDNGVDGFYAVDGATIRLTPPDTGYRGDRKIYALQVIQGRICTAYTHDELIYEPRNPRSDVILSGYGMSEVELLVKIVTGFLNALALNIRGFSDNAVPRGVMHLTGNYSQDDLVAFRRYWNSMVKGINSTWSVPVLVSKDQESRAEFQTIGNQFDEMYFSKWMTFLTSIICAVYGMSPDEINFEAFSATKSSLSGSDTAEKLADSKDKGLRPLLSYYESVITDYIVSSFGDKYVFRWAGLDDQDESQRFELRKLTLTLNEARSEQGYDPIKGALGDAPLNPSLIGPWTQLQQGQPQGAGAAGEGGGDADADAQRPNTGEDFGQRAEPQEAKPAQSKSHGAPPRDFGQVDGNAQEPRDFGQMRKANPYRDELQRFATAQHAAQVAIRSVMQSWQSGSSASVATPFMPVSESLADTLAPHLNVRGYAHAIDVSAVQHTMKNHGDAGKEVRRGQIAVTPEDFDSIPQVIADPDRILLGTRNRIGRPQIVYLKRMPDGSTLYLEEVRTGRRQLAMQSMRRYPATSDAYAILRTSTPNVRNVGGNGPIIIDLKPWVKALTGASVYRLGDA